MKRAQTITLNLGLLISLIITDLPSTGFSNVQ